MGHTSESVSQIRKRFSWAALVAGAVMALMSCGDGAGGGTGEAKQPSLRILATDAAWSPDGTWVATCSIDNTLRLWPMPDLDQPPIHTLPHNELGRIFATA